MQFDHLGIVCSSNLLFIYLVLVFQDRGPLCGPGYPGGLRPTWSTELKRNYTYSHAVSLRSTTLDSPLCLRITERLLHTHTVDRQSHRCTLSGNNAVCGSLRADWNRGWCWALAFAWKMPCCCWWSLYQMFSSSWPLAQRTEEVHTKCRAAKDVSQKWNEVQTRNTARWKRAPRKHKAPECRATAWVFLLRALEKGKLVGRAQVVFSFVCWSWTMSTVPALFHDTVDAWPVTHNSKMVRTFP